MLVVSSDYCLYNIGVEGKLQEKLQEKLQSLTTPLIR